MENLIRMSKICDKRIILGEEVLQQLSKEVYNVFGSYCKAAKALSLSYTEFWRFCNGKRKSIPESTLDKMCEILQINKNKLNFNILEPIETRFTLDVPLNKCLIKKDGKFFLNVKTLLVDSKYLDKLKELKGLIKNFNYKIEENQLIINFEVYDRGKKNFKKKIDKLPWLLHLNEELLYFLGLRFGDGTSGSRVGIINQNLDLLKFCVNFLEKFSERKSIEGLIMIYDKSELQNIQAYKINLESVGIFNPKVIKNYQAYGKYSYAIYINNNFLSKILEYLITSMKELWNSLSLGLKGSFLAGIFDAEGNVNKWDGNIRISQLTPNKVDLIDFILKQEKYNFRYDGCSFVIGNLKKTRTEDFKKFEKQILPYMKNKLKIREVIEMFNGNLIKPSFNEVVKVIFQRPGITQKELKEILNKRCDRELRALINQNYLRMVDYPRKYFITIKGLEYIK